MRKMECSPKDGPSSGESIENRLGSIDSGLTPGGAGGGTGAVSVAEKLCDNRCGRYDRGLVVVVFRR